MFPSGLGGDDERSLPWTSVFPAAGRRRSGMRNLRYPGSSDRFVPFLFLELRHKIEIHNLTGRVVECPIDETRRPHLRSAALRRQGAQFFPHPH